MSCKLGYLLICLFVGLYSAQSGIASIDVFSTDSNSTHTFNLQDTSKKTKPAYPGGEKELYKYIGQNLHYPEKSRNNNIQGRVIVEFTVSKSGALTDPEIVVGLDQFCDKEVLRIVAGMPNWTPGTLNGKPIDAKIKLPISFKSEKQILSTQYFLDSKPISEDDFSKVSPYKIKTLLIEREEFVTKMNIYTAPIRKVGELAIENIKEENNEVTFDIITFPENGVLKTEIVDGNGLSLSSKMILNPKAKNSVKLPIKSNAKKPIFIGINQLGTTMNINLSK